MLFKRKAWAILLAAMALPVAGQEFPTATEIMRPAPKKNTNTPRFAMAFGKVMARLDKSGTTKFNYQKGRLVSEVLPNSVIGTYRYDQAGKFQGIAYNDGKTITLAYNADGTVSGLTSNTKARIKFKGTYKAAPNRLPLRGFLAIQNGVSTIQNNYCIGTDDDANCTIVVEGGAEDGGALGDWGGWGSGGDPAFGPEPYAGTIYPRTGSVHETRAQCQHDVCDSGHEGFDKTCALVAKPGADQANCYSRSMEYYSKCLRSCENDDWAWLSEFNFIWG
jgi:YD repeat-containing protein